MTRPAPLTAGEFELMEIVWRLGEATVKQVWESVDPARNLAYTTVMTVLDKMRRKGHLRQRKQGKAFYYRAAIDRDAALHAILDQLVETYFGGSYPTLTAFVSRGEAPSGSPAPPHTPKQPEPAATAAREEDIDEFLL